MTRTRHKRQHPLPAAMLLAALLALFWRAIIPGGFMPDWQDGGLVVTVCGEQGLVTTVLSPDGTPRDGADTGSTTAAPCVFANLGLPMLPSAPMALLAVALTFILLSSRRPSTPVLRRESLRLRPPLRAPPVPVFA